MTYGDQARLTNGRTTGPEGIAAQQLVSSFSRRSFMIPTLAGVHVGLHDIYTRRAFQKRQHFEPALIVCLMLTGSVRFSPSSHEPTLLFPEGSCSLLCLKALTSGSIKIPPSTHVTAVLISFADPQSDTALETYKEERTCTGSNAPPCPRTCTPQTTLLSQSTLVPALHKVAFSMLERPISGLADRLWLGSRSLDILSTVLQHAQNCKKHDQVRLQLSHSDRRKVQDAHTLMLSQLDHEWTIRELATIVGLNENKLKRGFNIQFGSSVYACLQKNRMHVAASLLHKSSESVTDIALTVGYSSPAHFAKVFRRYHGFSPRDFRRA